MLQREAQVPTGAVDLDLDLDLEANEDFRDASSYATKSLLRDKVVQKYSKEGKRLPDIGPQPPAPSQQEVGYSACVAACLRHCSTDFVYSVRKFVKNTR